MFRYNKTWPTQGSATAYTSLEYGHNRCLQRFSVVEARKSHLTPRKILLLTQGSLTIWVSHNIDIFDTSNHTNGAMVGDSFLLRHIGGVHSTYATRPAHRVQLSFWFCQTLRAFTSCGKTWSSQTTNGPKHMRALRSIVV